MEIKIEVKNIDEFESLMERDDLKISTLIVETILKNIKTKKRFTYLMTIYLQEPEEIYDITLDKTYFIETLMEHLPVQEKNECFEVCQNIIKAIEYLENLNF